MLVLVNNWSEQKNCIDITIADISRSMGLQRRQSTTIDALHYDQSTGIEQTTLHAPLIVFWETKKVSVPDQFLWRKEIVGSIQICGAES